MSKYKLSVIEDNPTESFLLKMALANFKSLELELFSNGQGLVDSLEKGESDLYLVDMNLPDMHGTEVIKSIRRKFDNPGIIVMSAQIDMGLLSDLQENGIRSYIVKNKTCLTELKHVVERELFLIESGFYNS